MDPQKRPKNKKKKEATNPTSDSNPTSDPFEFCHVCRLNHDQGRRHKYFPSHLRSLSSFLSRFHNKLADLRFLLRNPTTSDQSTLDRFWCVFCGVDVLDLDSTIACSNAIYHLASAEHLKSVKDFLRKHGGGMDRADSLRVSDSELIKWEKACKLLESAVSTSSKEHIEPPPGPIKDIQHEITTNKDNFDNHCVSCFNSNTYNAVLPLQSLTNEGYRLHPQAVNGVNGATEVGENPYIAAALPVVFQGNLGPQALARVHPPISVTGKQSTQLGNDGKCLVGQRQTNGMEDQRNVSGEDCTRVLQILSQISFPSEGSQANVHTGALPPWLEAGEENELNQLNKESYLNTLTITPAQKAKSRKLNPKRVGAAWAEKRRIELEMEKRGERTPSAIDVNWLPNFGRVWQAGSRKESRKEFEMEKQKLPKDEKQPELSFTMQPYISKRMRTGSPNKQGASNGHADEIANTSLE